MKDMAFDYYYGNQADQFNFIKIPKTMITDPMFEDLSVNAKLLYGVLLDRMNLSMKNRWFDDENRVYIIYQVAEIMEDFNFSKKTAVKYLNELVEFGLVEKKRRGLGLPSLLYVKSFIIERDYSGDKEDIETSQDNCGDSRGVTSYTSRGVREETSRGVTPYTSRSVGEETSRGVNITLQEVTDVAPLNNKTDSSKTNINNTNESYITSNHITPTAGDRMGRDMIKLKYEAYEKLIKHNIDYDLLIENNTTDREQVDNLVDIMVEAIVSDKEYQIISGNRISTEMIKSRFCKLDKSHIEYVLDCLNHNSSDVRNIKKYLLATLYNAPMTMDSYYKALVQHDMPELAMRTKFRSD